MELEGCPAQLRFLRWASSRWRQISAQLGCLARASLKSFSAPGMSIFWGQTWAHAPQPRQAEGRLSSGRAYIAMVTLKFTAKRKSL